MIQNVPGVWMGKKRIRVERIVNSFKMEPSFPVGTAARKSAANVDAY